MMANGANGKGEITKDGVTRFHASSRKKISSNVFCDLARKFGVKLFLKGRNGKVNFQAEGKRQDILALKEELRQIPGIVLSDGNSKDLADGIICRRQKPPPLGGLFLALLIFLHFDKTLELAPA